MWLFFEDEIVNIDNIQFIAIEMTKNEFWELVAHLVDGSIYKLTRPTNREICVCILRNLKSKIIHNERYIKLIGIGEAKRRLECMEGEVK